MDERRESGFSLAISVAAHLPARRAQPMRASPKPREPMPGDPHRLSDAEPLNHRAMVEKSFGHRNVAIPPTTLPDG